MHTTTKARGLGRTKTRGVALAAVLLVAVWQLGCDTTLEDPTGPDAQLVDDGAGGKGDKGKPAQEPLHTIELSGAMSTPEGPQDAGPGTESKNKRVIGSRGHEAEECTDPDDTTTATGRCFRSELHMGLSAAQIASCEWSTEEPDARLALLEDDPAGTSSKARTSFSAEVSKRHGTALVRTFWWEKNDPLRYSLLIFVDSATETPAGSDVWTFVGGEVQLYYETRGVVTCPWTGQFVMTVVEDASP